MNKIIKHIHFESPIHYLQASSIQETKVRQFLDHLQNNNDIIEPNPTFYTFEFQPVYTTGRRQAKLMTQEEINDLKSFGSAEYVSAQRGGQTTFHGPGQLVCYPIINLRHYLQPHLRIRCYISMLEKSIISTLKEYDLNGRVTENTGVWIDDDNKIASIGVHCRRFITSHGIGLNINTDLRYFDRIVACGLPDKKMTSIVKELNGKGITEGYDVSVDHVGDLFVGKMGELLGCDKIEKEYHDTEII